MDDNSLISGLEDFNKIHPPAYRVAMKLESLQNIYRMDAVLVRHIEAALDLDGRAKQQSDSVLGKDEVTQRLNRMFRSVSPEFADHFSVEPSKKLCGLIFRMFDRNQLGQIQAISLHVALICLSAETLLLKYGGLACAAASASGSISRSSLTSLLEDVSQVPAVIQEEGLFGDVEDAVKSCFHGVLTSTVSREHVSSWLQSEPRLLLWLPVLYRLFISQKVVHAVHCHICKIFPIRGLRYRCVKCLKVHVCQSCFLSEQQTRKHKSHHPVIEFCTQPTWRETFSSFVHSARHCLLPHRLTQRGAERRKSLTREGAEDSHKSAPPLHSATPEEDGSTSSHVCVSHDSSVHPHSSSSKSLQTDQTLQGQLEVSTLLAEVRDLHRDRRLLEEQLQVWHLAVQSEHGMLKQRCAEMEVTMETVREHNLRLQATLTQTLNKLELQHANDRPPQHQNEMENAENTEKGNLTPTSDIETCLDEDVNTEELMLKTDYEWSENEETPPPTINQGFAWSHDIHYEEVDCADSSLLCQSIQQEDFLKEVDTGMANQQVCGTCSPEEMLQQTVDRLISVLWTDRRKDKLSGDKGLALIEAADHVGDSLFYLVDAVRQV
ncbi:dystrotelin isoform X2 [Phyllopteryx taeniolatus]|uniref:dystrotelin isoform X2 n=1 Tax=Phyllopteryx taeniolatus TaxID=161469 RepID=UPI002AD56EBF|nr:dystrotelin isoform X2 [Phyllopteryx taeniolatus]